MFLIASLSMPRFLSYFTIAFLAASPAFAAEEWQSLFNGKDLTGWSYREMEADGYMLPVVEAHCEYRQSARYDDELDIRATGVKLSQVRVRFNYDVVRVEDQAVLAQGYTVHASLDPSGRPRRLPERVQQMFPTGA